MRGARIVILGKRCTILHSNFTKIIFVCINQKLVRYKLRASAEMAFSHNNGWHVSFFCSNCDAKMLNDGIFKYTVYTVVIPRYLIIKPFMKSVAAALFTGFNFVVSRSLRKTIGVRARNGLAFAVPRHCFRHSNVL